MIINHFNYKSTKMYKTTYSRVGIRGHALANIIRTTYDIILTLQMMKPVKETNDIRMNNITRL